MGCTYKWYFAIAGETGMKHFCLTFTVKCSFFAPQCQSRGLLISPVPRFTTRSFPTDGFILFKETPVESPIIVRSGLKLVYDIYVSDRVRLKYKLKYNVTNDISSSLFVQLHHEATATEIIDIVSKGYFYISYCRLLLRKFVVR